MKWLALLTLIAASFLHLPAPVVRTGSGLVRGRISKNGKFYEYLGIPYGTVNESNRFQAPLPPPKWEGVFKAVNEHIRCPQTMLPYIVMGDPDCLKLYIYTPVQTHPERLFPVMVYIHGGCFFEGTGSTFLYGGDFFAEHGVVYVGVNYRLNVEGFLCLGIKEAPGNAGLKDQIAALKWIKENIQAFNGDPENVTLFGESAGAVSTSYLILSPAARGLFHRAILQSGSTLAPWGLQYDPIKTASDLVKQFGYDTKDPYEIFKIISNKTINELILGIKYSKHRNSITADTLFAPCIENQLPGVDAIITEHPKDIIVSGNYMKLPMIIGFNDNEGIYFVSQDYGLSLKVVNVSETLKSDLEFPTGNDRNLTERKVEEYYFSSNKEEKIMDMVNLYSDLHFKIPIVIESELYAKTTNQPIYYYVFKYGGLINMPKFISLFLLTPGASHADELLYILKPHMFPLPHFLESEMITRMVTLWSNFAKFGDPTPKESSLVPGRWRPSRESNPTALIIDRECYYAPMWDLASVRLWNETYTKYRRKPHRFKHSK